MLISSYNNIRQQGLYQIKKSYLNHSDKFYNDVI